jgi:excisionase family DNA binding protein
MNQNSERKPLLLRGGEVADALGISRALAYRWMQTGVLPTVRVSRSVRVPHDGLLLWIQQNTQHSGGTVA